jgi:hypothetical protein
VCPHINGKLESSDRTLAEGSPAGQTGITGLSPRSVDTPALLPRDNKSPLRIECRLRPRGELRNAGVGVVIARTPSRLWAGTVLKNFWCARMAENFLANSTTYREVPKNKVLFRASGTFLTPTTGYFCEDRKASRTRRCAGTRRRSFINKTDRSAPEALARKDHRARAISAAMSFCFGPPLLTQKLIAVA